MIRFRLSSEPRYRLYEENDGVLRLLNKHESYSILDIDRIMRDLVHTTEQS